MRRYATYSIVTLLVGAFLVAWASAQELGKRKTTLPRAASQGGEFAPRRLDSFDAAPIEASLSDDRSTFDPSVKPVAGGEPTLADPPADRPTATARKGVLGSSSRLGPTVLPATPVQHSVTADGELPMGDDAQSAPRVPSVLKKKAGAPPASPTHAQEPRLAPAVVASPTQVEPTRSTSSRRITEGATQPSSIRADESTAPRDLAAPPAATATQPIVTAKAAPNTLEISSSSPKLVVGATGPQAVTVGKLATYLVRLANEGQHTAHDVEVRIGLPQWVEVHGGQGTRGDAKQDTDAAGRQWLVWNLAEVPAAVKEQLTLEVVARENQPFELAIMWNARPSGISAEVAVREPQVEVRLEGPSDMLFGEQKPFTMLVSNPGTGDAENVVVDVSSSGAAPNRLQIGNLAAGEKKQVSFSVAALAPGEMEIRAVASGAGGLTAEAASRVLVHKAELQVALDAPPLKFAGNEMTYQVAVANVGDALAENVSLSITLPTGAKYVGGVDGAAAAGDGLTFKVGSLAAGSEKVFDIRCILTLAGENRIEAHAIGKGDLAAVNSGITKVEALAELKLVVNEPSSPVVVGTDAVYEVKVINRGTKAAEQVKVIVAFGQGIEPIEAMGSTAEVINGQAIFKPQSIGPGSEVVLKVRAKSETSGNHAFRVEVKGTEDTKLVSEGITRCFPDTSNPRATARKPGLTPVPGTKTR